MRLPTPSARLLGLGLLLGAVSALPLRTEAPAGQRPAQPPALCFASGTPRSVVDEVSARARSAWPVADDTVSLRAQGITRWRRTATNGDGLGLGEPITLTWSYVPDGTPIEGFLGEPAGASNLYQWLDLLFPGGFSEWHPLFVQAFAGWEGPTGVRYVYEPNDDATPLAYGDGVLGVRGDVRIGAHFIDGHSRVLGYNFLPDTGDMVLDSFDSVFLGQGDLQVLFRNLIAHEHGHGLGLLHVCPGDGTKLMEPIVHTAFEGPQHDEVRGAQRLYGDPIEEDDTAAQATPLRLGTATGVLSLDSALDQDWFEVRLRRGAVLDAVLEPAGQLYLQGPQTPECAEGEAIDSRRVRDLALELVLPDGSTVLVNQDRGAAGEAERLRFEADSAGLYYLRVFGNPGDGPGEEAQLYRLSLAGGASGGETLFAHDFEEGTLVGWTPLP